MHVMLPLTEGHLSNKDRISWQKGCPHERGTTVISKAQGNHTFQKVQNKYYAPLDVKKHDNKSGVSHLHITFTGIGLLILENKCLVSSTLLSPQLYTSLILIVHNLSDQTVILRKASKFKARILKNTRTFSPCFDLGQILNLSQSSDW